MRIKALLAMLLICVTAPAAAADTCPDINTNTADLDTLAKEYSGQAPLLTKQLSSHEVNTRRCAAELLSILKSLDAIGPLTKALKDKDYIVRWRAEQGLAQFADHPAVAAALIAAINDPEPFVRAQMLVSFENALLFNHRGDNDEPFIKDPKFVAVVTSALSDPKEAKEAARALAEREQIFPEKDYDAVGPLVAALRSPNPDARASSADALGAIKDALAFNGLASALNDTNSRVREHAAAALGSIGDRRATPPLISALEDAESGVRLSAAAALTSLKDPRAINALIDAFRRGDEAIVAGAHEFYIAQGVPGSEKILISALQEFGKPVMGTHYAYSGNVLLKAAAHAWAEKNNGGFLPLEYPGWGYVGWGSGGIDNLTAPGSRKPLPVPDFRRLGLRPARPGELGPAEREGRGGRSGGAAG